MHELSQSSAFLRSFLFPLVTAVLAAILTDWLIQKKRANERREKTLSALHAQVIALPRINTHNQTATDKRNRPKHVVPIPYPIAPFEKAMFSEDSVSVGEKTIKAATDYILLTFVLL